MSRRAWLVVLGACLAIAATGPAGSQPDGRSAGSTNALGSTGKFDPRSIKSSSSIGQSEITKALERQKNSTVNNDSTRRDSTAHQVGVKPENQFIDLYKSMVKAGIVVPKVDQPELNIYTIDKNMFDKRRTPVPPDWGLGAAAIGRPRNVCPQCQEVDTGGATIHLSEIGLDPRKRDLSGTGVTGQSIAACSMTVKAMRVTDTSGYSRIDEEGFNRQCLDRNTTGPSSTIAHQGDAALNSCFTMYAAFDRNCINTAMTGVDKELLKQSGILVRVAPGLPMQILCSAWRVNERTVLSARHCLAKQQLLSKGQNEVAPNSLTFIPYTEATTLRFNSANRLVGWTVTGEIGKDGAVQPLSYPLVKPKVEEDLVLLHVKSNNPEPSVASKTRPTVSIPENYQRGQTLTVVGFQEFVYRAYMASAAVKHEELPTDEFLVASGEWRKFIRVHRSPVCIGIPTDHDSLRHFCQTFGRTSGAAIFTITDSGTGGGRAYLVGVQSRGLERGESKRPNNEAVAVKRGIHPYLDKLLGIQ